MALEATPASVATDGNLRITFVDDASNPLSVAALNGGDDITYSLTPSGFTHGITENNIDDPRLTLKQIFNRPGTSTETLALQYIWGDADDVAYSVLDRGHQGVPRRPLRDPQRHLLHDGAEGRRDHDPRGEAASRRADRERPVHDLAEPLHHRRDEERPDPRRLTCRRGVAQLPPAAPRRSTSRRRTKRRQTLATFDELLNACAAASRTSTSPSTSTHRSERIA
jgi:hypothetical protein